MALSLFYFLSTVSIVGIIGNLIVTYVYIRKGDKHTASFFILVLAFSDLIVCSILVPSTIYMEYVDFRIESAFFCKLHYFITTTIVPSCCFLMTSIAFDRYFCICKASNIIVNINRAKVLVGVIICISILLGIIPSLSAVVELTSDDENFYLLNYTAVHNKTGNMSSIATYSLCYVDLGSSLGMFSRVLKSVLDVIYAVAIIVITVLYVLIYKEIYTRRKKREDRKRELRMTSMRLGGSNGNLSFNKEKEIPENPLNPGNTKKSRKFRQGTIRAKHQNFLLDDLSSTLDGTLKNNLREAEKNKRQTTKLLVTEKSPPPNENDAETVSKNTDTEKCVETTQLLLADIDEVSMPNPTQCSQTRNNSKTTLVYNNRHFISSKDVRTAVMLFVVTFLYILFFSPSMIATYYNMFISLHVGEEDYNEDQASLIDGHLILIFYLYYMNSAINPIIYCFLNPTFRKDLKKIFFSRDSCYNSCFFMK